MSENLTTPIDQSLFRLDEKRAAKADLMPGHWELYEFILTLTDEESIVHGSDLPSRSHLLVDGLLDAGVLTPAPLTYQKWQQIKETLQEAAKQKADNEASGIISSGDILDGSKKSGSVQEVDLDFLD